MLDLGRHLCLGLSRRGYPRLRLQLRPSLNFEKSMGKNIIRSNPSMELNNICPWFSIMFTAYNALLYEMI